MEERKEIKLPGSVADVTVGGGGRFFILHLPLVRQAAIFDVSEAKVVKYLSVDDEDALMAASLNKLFIALPKKNMLQKYDLHTFEREKTIPLPGSSGAGYMGTGSDVDGVLVFSPKQQNPGALRGAIFLSSISLQELPIRSQETGMMATYPPQVRFSGGGVVFTSWTPGLSPSGLRTFVINASGVQHYYEHTSPGYLLPSHDGRIIYTPSGLYTYEGKPLSGQSRNGGARMNGHYPIPSTRENWYLDCQPPSVMNRGTKPPPGESGVQVTLNLASTSRPIANLDNIDLSEVSIELGNRSNKMGFDKRVYFIAEAKTAILIPNNNDRLILYKVDIDELLKKSEIDYFFVMSTPKITAPKGTVYTYPIEVRSKQPGVKYRVEAGPSGLKVNAQGVVTWQVPPRIEDESVDVIISITNTAGEELLHDFRISIPGNRGNSRSNRPAGKK
ncbi:MAG: hypothetical protein QM703_10815 [Gemmatales bacterium]